MINLPGKFITVIIAIIFQLQAKWAKVSGIQPPNKAALPWNIFLFQICHHCWNNHYSGEHQSFFHSQKDW